MMTQAKLCGGCPWEWWSEYPGTGGTMRSSRTWLRVAIMIALIVVAMIPEAEGKKKKKSAKKVEDHSAGVKGNAGFTSPGNAGLAPSDEDPKTQAFLSYGNTPLHDAARDGNFEMVRNIVEKKPGVFRDARFSKWDYDEPEDYPTFADKNDAGNNPLMLATWINNKEIVQVLLDAGAPVSVRNRAGNTPIMWASRQNDTSILKLLIERGADVNAKDDKGFTALHFAAFADASNACEILIDKGADVDARTENGHSPVFSCAEFHKPNALRALIKHGANVKLRDYKTNGPVDLCSGRAASQGYTGEPHEVQTLEQLRAAGAIYWEEEPDSSKAAFLQREL